MLPNFLLPESVLREDGSSEAIDLGSSQGMMLQVTLGITRIIEQESLDVSISGSTDGSTWSDKPLLAFPQKFYCGTYSMTLDLGAQPEVCFLKVNWKMNRWGRGEPQPLFGFYVFAEPVEARVAALR